VNPERAADGVGVGEEVMIRRRRTQARRLILGRGIPVGEEMEGRRDGDLGFGQGFWEARLRDIWQAIEERDSSRCRRGVVSGLGAAGGTMTMEIQEGVQVEARLVLGAVLGMRAQGSGRRLEDSACIICTYLALDWAD
jgi:hypothetical protein